MATYPNLVYTTQAELQRECEDRWWQGFITGFLFGALLAGSLTLTRKA